jgi:acyl-CoA thioesterase
VPAAAVAHIEVELPIVPHGGLITAAAYGDGRGDRHPEQSLRSVSTVFAAPVQAGDIEIDVSVLRRGRSLTQLAASVHNPGAAAGHSLVAVFGAERPGFEFTDLRPPVVPPPQECPSFGDPPPPEFAELFAERTHMNFWDHADGRAASGHAPWDPYIPSSSERAAWYRFNEPPMLDDGRLDPLAILTMCDTMPGAVGERMGRRQYWLPPSCDLTVHMLGDAHTEWILAVNRCRAHRRVTRRPRWKSGTAPASTSSPARRNRWCSCSPTARRRPSSGCRARSCDRARLSARLLEELPEHRADLALTPRLRPRNTRRARHPTLGIRDAELPLPAPTAPVHRSPFHTAEDFVNQG